MTLQRAAAAPTALGHQYTLAIVGASEASMQALPRSLRRSLGTRLGIPDTVNIIIRYHVK